VQAGDKAIVVPVGGNVLYFLVPLRPGYLAMGCTDTDYPVSGYGELDHVPSTEEEVRSTLAIFDRVLPGAFARDQVVACYAGVRPLVRPPQAEGRALRESDTSRTHRIWRTPGGVWAIAGGKYTTFRLMAEQLTDRVVEELAGSSALAAGARPCTTADRPYHPAADRPSAGPETLERALARRTGLETDCCRHLASAYGTAAGEVAGRIERDPVLGERIAADRPFVMAELEHAVEREMCRGVADFLARRTQLRFLEHQGLDVLDKVADRLAVLLGWDAAARRRQAEEYREHIRRVTPSRPTTSVSRAPSPPSVA
jgi:glycerol-3-phosphate dehydrogenase